MGLLEAGGAVDGGSPRAHPAVRVYRSPHLLRRVRGRVSCCRWSHLRCPLSLAAASTVRCCLRCSHLHTARTIDVVDLPPTTPSTALGVAHSRSRPRRLTTAPCIAQSRSHTASDRCCLRCPLSLATTASTSQTSTTESSSRHWRQ
jgi:hypothetical protein